MSMLQSRFKSGAAGPAVLTSEFAPTSLPRHLVAVPSKSRSRSSLPVVSASASDGWLTRSVSAGVSTVTSVFDKLLNSNSGRGDPTTVHMKATAVISKKLLKLDLVDRAADLQDDASEVMGHKVSITLVSTKIDPKTGKAMLSRKVPLENWIATLDLLASSNFDFKLNYFVPKDFGIPGAILVENEHPNEFNLVDFSIALPDNTVANFATHSWVYNTQKDGPRIFFRNQAYLPSETPAGLKELREKELKNVRGDGTGKREFKDRIYDYEVYNNLGMPDEDPKWERPNLGGDPVILFPRRCRTGRPPSKFNPKYESRAPDNELIYIPRDERFDRVKNSDFKADRYVSQLHAAPTTLQNKFRKDTGWASMKELKGIFAPKGEDLGGLNNTLPDKPDIPKNEQNPLVFLQELLTPNNQLLAIKYPLPKVMRVDENAWEQDDEFSREFLAGLNPIRIQRVKEFPIKSSLPNNAEFGDPTSAITEKHIADRLEGLSVQDAVAKKKLFVADYHDMFLPFVNRINENPARAMYATRALFFLTKEETLKVLALELVRPPKDGKPKRSRVFTPPTRQGKNWVWELAKAHVQNNDICVHQVISHFSRCHACTEPYLLATNRQLSPLHPIYQNLKPHFKSTMEINTAARNRLINANGTIETVFTPQEYAMRMAAIDYGKHWTFDNQTPTVDLVNRGMAEPSPGAKHGLKLVIEDYPYAADGLEYWDAINTWNRDYVNIFYKSDDAVRSDTEVQRWWTEIREVGHGDRRDAPGWPKLDSRGSLAHILSTIQWVVSVQHAAVNFGQYHYGGFMPHHPTFTRRLVPEPDSAEMKEMEQDPEKFYLSALSSREMTTKTMSVYEVLSSHSPDEEYIGQRRNPNWTASAEVKAAFQRFGERVNAIDKLITERNANPRLKNRLGPARYPYELQRATSEQGMTGRGIPNSITI